MLKIQSFNKSYSGKKILVVDELLIPPGIHWIKGTNGSGKSTFFRSVAGIVPFEGKISWNGLDQKEEPINYRRKVSMSEAEPLYPEFLSAYDILTFINKARQGTLPGLESLADRLGIPAYWKNPCGTYSSGMLKKVAVISAFLGTPELIILDEPLITLDAESIIAVTALVQEFHAVQGTSFLLSSHQDTALDQLAVVATYQVIDQTITRV